MLWDGNAKEGNEHERMVYFVLFFYQCLCEEEKTANYEGLGHISACCVHVLLFYGWCAFYPRGRGLAMAIQGGTCGRSIEKPGPPWAQRPETEQDVQERRIAEAAEQQFQVPIRMCRALEAIDFEAELRRPVRTVREPPRWFRGQFKKAMGYTLREWQRSRNVVAW